MPDAFRLKANRTGSSIRMFLVNMGKTSNTAKQKWNSTHYAQIKVHVKPETASAFKAACAVSGTSMASELSAFMEEFAKPQQKALSLTKVKTLGDRRKAMCLIINLLTEIRDAEEAFLENTPENLHNSTRYEMAEERLERLIDVLDAADGIYD